MATKHQISQVKLLVDMYVLATLSENDADPLSLEARRSAVAETREAKRRLHRYLDKLEVFELKNIV